MKQTVLILFYVVMTITAISQNTEATSILITKFPKEVPPGKKWILQAGQKIKIQLSEGSLRSGTMCNAMLFSNPHIVTNINKGDYYNSESFGIIFKDLTKVPYTNDNTYEITPLLFIDKDFSLADLTTQKAEDIGLSVMEFYNSETVFVSSCLESIELIELPLSKEEMDIREKKIEELEKQQLKQELDVKKVEENVQQKVMKQQEDDRIEKILNPNSDGFFYSLELSNLDSINILINKSVLIDIYNYINELQKNSTYNSEDQLIAFKSSEYSIFKKYKPLLLFAYFDRNMLLSQIKLRLPNEVTMPHSYLARIAPNMFINSGGKIFYQGVNYPVNSAFIYSYSYNLETIPIFIRIKKSSQGIKEIHFNSQSMDKKINKEELMELLIDCNKIKNLKMGDYSIKAKLLLLEMSLKDTNHKESEKIITVPHKILDIESILKG